MSFKKLVSVVLSVVMTVVMLPMGTFLSSASVTDKKLDYTVINEQESAELTNSLTKYYTGKNKYINGLTKQTKIEGMLYKDGVPKKVSYTQDKPFTRLVDGDMANETTMGFTYYDYETKTYLGPTGKYYTDITLTLSETISSDYFYVLNHKNPELRTYHYALYVSKTKSELYNDSNQIVDFYNEGADQLQIFQFNNFKEFKYYGIRVYDPTCGKGEGGTTVVTSTQNNIYIRLWELGATVLNENFRELENEDISLFDGKFTSLPTIQNGEHNLLKGKLPYSVTLNDNGAKTDFTNGSYSELTDEKSSTYSEIQSSDIIRYDEEGVADGKAFYDIEYDLGEDSEITKLSILNHGNSDLMTGEYQIFFSKTKSDLFKPANCVYGFVNRNNNRYQEYTYDVDKHLMGRYLALRIFDPICNHETGYSKSVRFSEIYALGRQFEPMLDRSIYFTKQTDNAESTDAFLNNVITDKPVITTAGSNVKYAYNLNGICDINTIDVYNATASYKLYLSYAKSTLFEKENLIYDFSRDGSAHQKFTSNAPTKTESMFLGILASNGFNVGDVIVNADKFQNSFALKENADAYIPTGTNLLKNAELTSKFTQNIFPYITAGYQWSSPANIVDSNPETAADVTPAMFELFDDTETAYYYRNGEYYFDTCYELSDLYDIEKIAIVNHKNKDIVTGHYKLYVSDNFDTLFDDDRCVYDYVNLNGMRSQLFEGHRAGRFIGLRIVDPVYNYSSDLCKAYASHFYNYPRLSDIAVFGTKSDTTPLLNSYSLNDKYVYSIPMGTSAGVFIDNCINSKCGVYSDGNKIFGKNLVKTGMDLNINGTKSRTLVVNGDTNGDGKVTVTDIINTNDYIVSGDKEIGQLFYAADLDRNNVVNVSDVVNEITLIFDSPIVYNPYADVKKNPMLGRDVTGTKREIDVECDTVISDNFIGFGSNIFPANSCEEAVYRNNYVNNAYMEFNAERFASLNLHYTRMWYQIDWMITNEEKDYIFKTPGYGFGTDVTSYLDRDDTDNKDRINYENRIYDFENENMQSVYKQLQMLKDCDTPVSIDFGWKCATRIWSWFNYYIDDREGNTTLKTNMSRNSAPKDLDAYADACAAFLKEVVINREFTNVEAVSFYNEPSAGDFQCQYDSSSPEEIIYWTSMFKKCYAAVQKMAGTPGCEALKNIKFSGAEESGPRKSYGHSYADDIYNNCNDICWAYLFHLYLGTGVAYNQVYDIMGHLVNLYKNKPVFTTETYGADYNYDPSNSYMWTDWTVSWAANFIASANAGVKAICSWGCVGGFLPNPTNFDPADGSASSWRIPYVDNRVDDVHIHYYEQSLYTNYIPRGSDVLYTNFDGKDDIHATAFRTPSNDYTVIVEVNGTNKLVEQCSGGTHKYNKTFGYRNVTLNFSKPIGKVYMYEFNPYEISKMTGSDNKAFDMKQNANATVLRPYGTKNVNGTKLEILSDTEYKVYVITTMEPIKQVEMKTDVIQSCAPGGSVKLESNLLDCDANDEIVWKVSQTTGKSLGKITPDATNKNKATYTASNVTSGTDIAIRASLKSDPKHVFAVTLVHVK